MICIYVIKYSTNDNLVFFYNSKKKNSYFLKLFLNDRLKKYFDSFWAI